MEPDLPSTSVVAPLVRWNRWLADAPTPRLVAGGGLVAYAVPVVAYVALLLACGVPVLSTYLLVHVAFAGVLIGLGGPVLAAGLARRRGSHGLGEALEGLAFKTLALALAVGVAAVVV